MKCSYHPTVDSQAFCTACSKALCAECSHRIKGKVYCQDCLVRGAEWAATGWREREGRWKALPPCDAGPGYWLFRSASGR